MNIKDCIFCQIINAKLPCAKLEEGDSFLAFLDIKPVVEGHTLVIPKNHFKDLSAIDESSLMELMRAVRMVAKKLVRSIDGVGFNIYQSNGRNAGQVIDHLHFHIFPRKNLAQLNFINLPSTEQILIDNNYFSKYQSLYQ